MKLVGIREEIEERMMSEYVSQKLQGRKTWTHIRLGMPPGLTIGSPNWEYERRLKMPRLLEADLIYRAGDVLIIAEFKVRRFQEAIGKLLQYRLLVPETPDFLDQDPAKITLRIVFGRPDSVAENLAKSLEIQVEHYEPAWLKQAIIDRAGSQI